MKRILCILCAFIILGTNALAASFEIDSNPDYRSALVDMSNADAAGKYKSTYGDTSKPVDFNKKSSAIAYLYNYKPADWFGTEYELSWVPGPSGEEGDWAPCVTATSNAKASKSAQLYLFYQGGDQKLKDGGGTIYADFDLMVNTTTDRLQLADIPMWNPDTGGSSRYLLEPDGYIRGTGYQYKAGEWMHFKMIVDYEAKTWNVWVDDEKVVDNMPIASRYSWDKNTRFQFFISQISEKQEGEPRAGFAVDNFLAYATGKDISEYVSLSASSENSDSDELDSVSKNPVLNLEFEDGTDASLFNNENIIVENEKGAHIPCEVTANGQNCTVIPQRTLNHEETYKLRISDEIRKSISSYRPPVGSFEFTVNNNRDVVITSAEAVKSNNSLNLEAVLENNTGGNYESGIIAAIYNSSNGIVAISRKLVTLTSGQNSLSDFELSVPEGFSDDYTVRLFVTPASQYRIIDEEILGN